MSQMNSSTVIITTEANNSGQQTNQTVIVTNSSVRNKPQSSATCAAPILFMSTGMNMALGLGWAQYSLFGPILHFCYSWFIGVIIGTILAIPLRMFISKKYILGAACVLVIVGGIIFTSVPLNYNAILAARYINGIALGLVTVTFLLHASDVAVDAKRGIITSMEQYAITFGIAIQMIYSSYWSIYDFPILRLHGIFDIIFGVIAAIMLMFYIESPIDQLRLDDEPGALNSLTRLQSPCVVTLETNAWLEQCKMYVREHESMSFNTSLRLAMWPLVKMLFFRSASLAFSFSMPLNIALQYSVVVNRNSWVPTLAACFRVLGAIVTISVIDSLRRKLPAIIWIACMGGLLIGVGCIFKNILSAILDSSSMTTTSALYIVLQLFAGFFAPYTSVLLPEAFPLRVKGLMMDICVIVEQLIQIILINTINTYIGTSLMVQGIIMLFTFVAMIVTLPETKGTSMAEAQRRFRRPYYTKFS